MLKIINWLKRVQKQGWQQSVGKEDELYFITTCSQTLGTDLAPGINNYIPYLSREEGDSESLPGKNLTDWLWCLGLGRQGSPFRCHCYHVSPLARRNYAHTSPKLGPIVEDLQRKPVGTENLISTAYSFQSSSPGPEHQCPVALGVQRIWSWSTSSHAGSIQKDPACVPCTHTAKWTQAHWVRTGKEHTKKE